MQLKSGPAASYRTFNCSIKFSVQDVFHFSWFHNSSVPPVEMSECELLMPTMIARFTLLLWKV